MSSSQAYSRVLQNSKVVRTLAPGTKQQVFSAPPSFRKRNDYGFKRRLPPQVSAKTPVVQLRELDTSYDETDYRTAAAQSSFVKNWDESELGAVTARRGHQFADRTPKPVRIEASRFDVGSREAVFTRDQVEVGTDGTKQRPAVPDVLDMDKPSFARLVASMRTPRMRALFRQFVKEARPARPNDLVDAAAGPPAADEEEDLYGFAQKATLEQRLAIEDFFDWLAQHSHDDSAHIRPSPHPNLGLAYAHPDPLHAERLTPPLPGRVLDGSDRTDAREYAAVAGLVGRVSAASGLNLSVTPFEPDGQGTHNLAQGRHELRIDPFDSPPAVNPFDLPKPDDFQGFKQRDPGEANRVDDPGAPPEALTPGRVRVSVKEARPIGPSVGGMDWVGGTEERESDWLGRALNRDRDADLLSSARGGRSRSHGGPSPAGRRDSQQGGLFDILETLTAKSRAGQK